MDFFKSVFSKDPEPSESSDSENPNPKPNTMWSSVIDYYRKDFEEFRSGLKKETTVIREAASRAVKDLPASFEVGASVAQESLESVGQAIDDIGSTVWKSTAEIISHGRRNLLTHPPDQYNSDSDNNNNNNNNNSRQLSDVKPYSRFEMQLHSIQSDYNTYCREPEDLEEYEIWKLGFKLDDEKDIKTENLVKENGVIGEIYRDLVFTNKVIDEETFWSRYFYRVHKLKQAEEARARLVKRAISTEEDEDLSWDFDDDDEEEEENNGSLVKGESSGNLEHKKRDSDENSTKKNEAENSGIEEVESDKLVVVEEKAENGGGSCKDSDVSIVSSQPSMPEEEDLSWDAIEDIGSNDENKGDVAGSASRADLQKRLGAAEEDEDLSWDIEDDVEPVKS